MKKRLVVTGGDGFIGRHVCRIAVSQGHDVTSIARSGRGDVEGAWADQVEWIQANVLQPETWREHLTGADAVVHCVGIMRENPSDGTTYERINDDAAEMVAWEAEHARVPRFIFLSADTPRRLVPNRFLESKRRAEAGIRQKEISESFLRPTFVYGPDRPTSMIGARLLQAVDHIPGLHDMVHPNRPLRVEQVALAAVRAAVDEGYDGVISVDNIEYLAGDEWKAYANGQETGTRARTLMIGGAVAAGVAGVALGMLSRARR